MHSFNCMSPHCCIHISLSLPYDQFEFQCLHSSSLAANALKRFEELTVTYLAFLESAGVALFYVAAY